MRSGGTGTTVKMMYGSATDVTNSKKGQLREDRDSALAPGVRDYDYHYTKHSGARQKKSPTMAYCAMYKRLNLVPDDAGIYALVQRGGRLKRYHHLTPASLARCRCIIRRELAAQNLRRMVDHDRHQ